MTPFAAIKALVDGDSRHSVTHHPGTRVAAWNAGGVDETIGARLAAAVWATSQIRSHVQEHITSPWRLWIS